jgi:type IV secretory pathway VirB10-like protein
VVSDQPNGKPEHQRDRTPELRLHPERPPVMRLSRKAIIGFATFTALAISGALIWALTHDLRKPESSGELYNTESKPTPDALASLPRDYASIPKSATLNVPSGIPPLGPPLPGDLGRPMLSAGVPPSEAFPGIDAAQQKLAQEQDAARTSKLFATVNATQRPITPTNLPTATSGESIGSLSGPTDASPLDGDWAQNMQDRKLAFVNAAVDRKTVSPDRLANPASRYVVQAGTVIPAALVTGIRSDLPGQVTAQVTEHIYDSPTGKYLLIPQGSKLIGVYDSQIAFGQDRILLVWTRLILPNGRSIVLERQPGADPQGFAGLEDEVDHHWGRLAAAAALSTLLGVGAELGATNAESNLLQALRRGTATSLNQTGQQVVRRNLNIQPTLTIRPGFPVRVIVARDLVLALYRT